MTAIPQPLSATVQAIYAAYERRRAASPARGYLGASVIGHACDRYLWLSFRWAGAEEFDGRMLRLFDRGQRAEARFVEELREVGAEVHELGPDGKQFAVQAVGGHFRGHMDGAALGLPEAPKSWHVLEFKTHNAKSFKELQAKGVREAKPMHWAQMQAYMLLTDMDRALYLAENKDTDELYSERVHLERVEAQRLIQRAERLVNAAEPPPRLSADPAWHVCKYCAFHAQCHAQEAPAVNCRTCAHSTPTDAGKWTCSAGTGRAICTLPEHHQQVGCDMHRYIPVLLERIGAPVDADAARNTVTYRAVDGGTFTNGEPPEAFSSAEIRACKDKAFLTASAGMADVLQWRRDFGARVVG